MTGRPLASSARTESGVGALEFTMTVSDVPAERRAVAKGSRPQAPVSAIVVPSMNRLRDAFGIWSFRLRTRVGNASLVVNRSHLTLSPTVTHRIIKPSATNDGRLMADG